ncbi:SDR family oxidoreductase [Pendulispora rubella]|uniref:NADP-dependent 3-hydroxy acid dehydrogenase YdfG n=1 Tax=Pendulispora rubella TaxID=2741070 RepID=A0ABZ2LDS3_9BACT
MSEFRSKNVAVITGASSGIGAVYAERLAARGYDLVVVARRVDRLRALADKISTANPGIQVEVVEADLTTESGLARVEKILATQPNVHIFVNNAGLARVSPLAKSATSDSTTQIALNIVAFTRLTRAILPVFLSRNAGVIVNLASALAVHSLPVSSVYSGTKAYVLNFSRGLQQEVAGTGVKVQIVLPATTATEIWDGAGVSPGAVPPDTVMTTENMVDAALAGLDQGETITWPSLADASLWEKYDAARTELFVATQTSKPAPRYKVE